MKIAFAPIRQRDAAAYQRYMLELMEFRSSEDRAKQEPIATQYMIDDATMESVWKVLAANPRGVLAHKDELAGHFHQMNQYRSGADEQRWLSMFTAQRVSVNRAGSGLLVVETPLISIYGGIQPGILKRLFDTSRRESGMLARFLVAYPPQVVSPFSDDTVSARTESLYARALNKIYDELKHSTMPNGAPTPVPVGFTADARLILVRCIDELRAERSTMASGDLKAAWARLEQYAIRLSLVLHVARWASCSDRGDLPGMIEATTVRDAVRLVRWFSHETPRVYGMMQETVEDGDRRELVELMSRHVGLDGMLGMMRVRELQRARPKLYTTADAAETVLIDLVDNGLAEWQHVVGKPQGGTSTRACRLHSAVIDIDGTPEIQAGQRGCVNVDAQEDVQ